MIPDRVRGWLVRLYPRGWQERYGAEFDLLLEQCLHTPLDVVDVFLGAVDAHLQLVNGENVTWRIMNMVNKMRTSLLIVFAAYIGFIIAGFSLVGLADDSPMVPLMQTNRTLAAAWGTIQGGAAVALLAVVIGGLPLAWTVLRRAFGMERKGLKLLMVPVIAFLVLVLYAGFIGLVGTGRIQIAGVTSTVQPDNFPVGNKLMLAGLMVVFILGAIASTIAVWKVVSGTDTEQGTIKVGTRQRVIKVYSFAIIPAVITVLAMVVMLVATVIWGRVAFTALPEVFAGNYGLWQTSTHAWFYGILALMSLCSLVAVFGLARGLPARKAV